MFESFIGHVWGWSVSWQCWYDTTLSIIFVQEMRCSVKWASLEWRA